MRDQGEERVAARPMRWLCGLWTSRANRTQKWVVWRSDDIRVDPREEPQAGAMVNLANVTAILIASSPKGRDRVGLSVGGRATWAIGFRDMRDVLITQLKQRFPEETGEGQTSTGWRAAVDELILIARENG